jgi:hypothetical protein
VGRGRTQIARFSGYCADSIVWADAQRESSAMVPAGQKIIKGELASSWYETRCEYDVLTVPCSRRDHARDILQPSS